MREYAALREAGSVTTGLRLRLLEAHQAGLREQIARLRAHEKALTAKITAYRDILDELPALRRNGTDDDRHDRTTPAVRARQGRLDAIDGEAGANVIDALSDISPELAHQVVAWGFGEIYSRPGLEPRDRQLVTLGMLTALGGCEPQLEVHINASLNVGLTPQQIIEALLHSAVYCGFPRALNATLPPRRSSPSADCSLPTSRGPLSDTS